MEKSEKVYAFGMPEKDRQKAENDGSGSLFATNMILFCINLLIIMLVAAAVHWVFHLATYSDSPESEKISELSEALQELKLRMEHLTTEGASPEESDYEYEVVSRDDRDQRHVVLLEFRLAHRSRYTPKMSSMAAEISPTVA